MLFTNSNLILIWKYLSYKNVKKMRALLTKLPYNKVTWWIKNLNIVPVTADIVLKEYLIYYLNIILVI